MICTKTYLRRIALKSLAELNDQICFYLFLDSQSWPAIEKVVLDRPALFTIDSFPENPRANQIHVQLGRLPFFRGVQTRSACANTFALAVEQTLHFVREIAKLWARLNSCVCETNDPIEKSLSEAFSAQTGQPIDSKLVEAIKYFRLRRNHIIHIRRGISGEMSAFLRQSASRNQRIWNNQTELYPFDFSNSNIQDIEPDELIVSLKLLRIVIEELDTFVASHLNVSAAVAELEAELIAKFPTLRSTNHKILERRARKLRQLSEVQYGALGSLEDFQRLLRI